jgi:hypothetical protein
VPLFDDTHLVSCRLHLAALLVSAVEFLKQLPVELALAPAFTLSALVALELAVVRACLPTMAHLVPAVLTKPVSVLQLLKSTTNIVISNV